MAGDGGRRGDAAVGDPGRGAGDLSHCGTRTTATGIAASKRPPLITHSGCREVYRHPRNKEDRELKAMADKGGVVGIYLMPFLGGFAGPNQATNEEALARHIEHALKLCGVDHVGVGSDASVTPIDETPEHLKAARAFAEGRAARNSAAPDEDRPVYLPALNHPRRLEGIAELLARRGHAAATIEKVVGGNFHRVLKDIWKH